MSHLPHPKYRPDIDGLRAVAVLAVVAFHAFPTRIRGGFTGVDVFFVISGFLISSILFENLDKGTFSFAQFYARRVKRIFPALILVLMVSTALGWYVLLSDEYKQLGKHIAAGTGFVSNFVLWSEAGYFDGSSETKPLLHLWSLSVEEQFYVLWPVLLWVAWKVRVSPLLLTLAITLISFSFNIVHVTLDSVATFYFPQTRFWELLCGGLLAWLSLYKRDLIGFQIEALVESVRNIAGHKFNAQKFANTISVLGFILLVYGFAKIEKEFMFPGLWAVAPVMGTVLLIASGRQAWINRVFLSNRLAVGLGLISFPLYLWHWPLLSFARIVESGAPRASIRMAIVFLSMGLAWMTYRYIEQPIRFGAHGKFKVPILVGLAVTIGFAGMIVSQVEGFSKSRLSRFMNLDITDASMDRQYTRGLTEATHAHVSTSHNGTDTPHALLLGDSHMEQYGSRIAFLSEENKAKPALMMIAPGCPPIPNVYEDRHPQCAQFINIVSDFLKTHASVRTVVIGACWNCYFIDQISPARSDGQGFRYYYKTANRVDTFRSGLGKEKALQAFMEFVRRLTVQYTVYILLDNPAGTEFDPKFRFGGEHTRHDFTFSYHNGSSMPKLPSPFERDPKQVSLEIEMENLLKGSGAYILKPSSVICPNSICSSVDSAGKLIFMDRNHLRASYIRTKMSLIDEAIAK